MDPGVDVVTEKSNNVDHVDDLNNLKIQTTTRKADIIKTTTLTTTTTSTTLRSKGMVFLVFLYHTSYKEMFRFSTAQHIEENTEFYFHQFILCGKIYVKPNPFSTYINIVRLVVFTNYFSFDIKGTKYV